MLNKSDEDITLFQKKMYLARKILYYSEIFNYFNVDK